MHVVLARYCYRKSSVRVFLSVCDVEVLWEYEHIRHIVGIYIYIGWTSSKVITGIISLGSFAPRSHNIGNLVQVKMSHDNINALKSEHRLELLHNVYRASA